MFAILTINGGLVNKIPNGLPAATKIQASLPSAPPSRIVLFPLSARVAKPLTPERLSLYDGLALYVTSLYELNKLVITAVYSFFEARFSGRASSNVPAPVLIQKPALQQPSVEALPPRPSVIVPFEAAIGPVFTPPIEVSIPTIEVKSSPVSAIRGEDYEGSPERELQRRLALTFPSLIQGELGDALPILLGQYFDIHLFKGKQSVAFDRNAKTFTLKFPERQEILLRLGEGIVKKIGDRAKDIKFCLAETVKVKISEGKMEFLEESLTISGKYKHHVFIPEVAISVAVLSLADPHPFAEMGHLAISAKLNGGMNPIVEKLASTLSDVLKVDLSQLRVSRGRWIQLLHRSLYPNG